MMCFQITDKMLHLFVFVQLLFTVICLRLCPLREETGKQPHFRRDRFGIRILLHLCPQVCFFHSLPGVVIICNLPPLWPQFFPCVFWTLVTGFGFGVLHPAVVPELIFLFLIWTNESGCVDCYREWLASIYPSVRHLWITGWLLLSCHFHSRPSSDT